MVENTLNIFYLSYAFQTLSLVQIPIERKYSHPMSSKQSFIVIKVFSINGMSGMFSVLEIILLRCEMWEKECNNKDKMLGEIRNTF